MTGKSQGILNWMISSNPEKCLCNLNILSESETQPVNRITVLIIIASTLDPFQKLSSIYMIASHP